MTVTSATESTRQISETLARAPVLMFLLVAAADGQVDKKELRTFQKLLAGKKYEVLLAMMQQSPASAQETIVRLMSDGRPLRDQLLELSDTLDAAMPADTARTIKMILVAFAKEIAEASGGFLGLFGSKVSDEETAALAVIAHSFGLLGGASHAGAGAAPPPPFEEVPRNLFPVLKSEDWGRQSRAHVVLRNVHGTEENRDGEPVVGYAIDADETVEFVNPDRLGPGMSLDTLHAGAVANLEARLKDKGAWRSLKLDLSDNGHGIVAGLVFDGDFYCSEALLSENILKQAHAKLDSAFLILAVPERGMLFATDPIDPENIDPAKVAFMMVAIKPYFNSHAAPIAPTVWVSRNGRIVGTMSGTDDVVEAARRAAEEDRTREDSTLQCTVSRTGAGDAFGLCLTVVARDLDVMFKNLQHLIRNHSLAVSKEAQYTGALHVVLTVEDPDYDPAQREGLGEALDELFNFLTGQIQSLFDRSECAKRVALTYSIVAE